MANGIYIVADLFGAEADRIAAVQRTLDPKLANLGRPHITLAGSSGLGILPTGTPARDIELALALVGAELAPLDLQFGPPERFPQTNIVMLPLPVHGPVRWLHDRIGRSGLPFGTPKFAFTPHCTIHFFRTMEPATWRAARAFRVGGLIRVDRIQAYDTRDPQPSRLICEVELRGV
jgi:2'-5' RNA ligase